MKKMALLAATLVAGIMMTGCGGLVQTQQGFATVAPGALISQMKGATYVQDRDPGRSYKVMKNVTASAQTVSYLSIVSLGDASYATLKEKALKGTGADDIINLEVDYTHDNILGIINKVTVEISGTAVKY